MPGLKQPWPIKAACWSPAMPSTRMGAPNSAGSVTPNSPALSRTCGSRLCGTPNNSHRLASHCPLPMSNSAVRAALLASVACTLPPVSRHNRKLSMVPKASLPASAAARAPVDVVEQPGDLAGGEIRIEQQAGLGRDLGLVAGVAQGGAIFGGAAVLPDDRIVDRLAGRTVPDHGGLALIGDADAGDIARGKPRLLHRLAHGRDRGGPDRLGVVLDLARRRIDLLQFLLGGRKRIERGVERYGARRGRTLVDGDESGRQRSPRAVPDEAGDTELSST